LKTVLEIVVFIATVYVSVGVVFSILFLWKGVYKVDPATKKMSFWAKSLLFPGVIFFWIFFIKKWFKSP